MKHSIKLVLAVMFLAGMLSCTVALAEEAPAAKAPAAEAAPAAKNPMMKLRVFGFIKELGGQGVVWLKKGDDEFKSSLKIESSAIKGFFQDNSIDTRSIVFLIGDVEEKALFLSGKLRESLGKDMIDKDELAFLWVVDFPLFFYNEDE